MKKALLNLAIKFIGRYVRNLKEGENGIDIVAYRTSAALNDGSTKHLFGSVHYICKSQEAFIILMNLFEKCGITSNVEITNEIITK